MVDNECGAIRCVEGALALPANYALDADAMPMEAPNLNLN